MPKKILIVEDEANIRELLRLYLEREGYTVLEAENGVEGIKKWKSDKPDMLLLDVMMPVMDGWELTRELRRCYPRLPIMLVTARDTIEDKRTGFTSGADDYLTKPVDLDELLLHVQALLRRSQAMTSHQLTIGQTHLDYDSLTVQRGDTLLTLPKKEFFLLFKLLSSPMQIFTRRQLMDEIWGMDAQSDERTVDVHIKRLREKCEIFPDFSIVTVRGLGYKAVKNG